MPSFLHSTLTLQGPFSTFHVQNDPNIEWTGVKFSSDGKMILLATNGGVIHLIDAFQGTQLHAFTVSTLIFDTVHKNYNALKGKFCNNNNPYQ